MSTSKHNPNGGATPHCDSERIESLIVEYKATSDVRTLATIVDLTQERALTLIRFRKTARYRAEDELLSDVNFKLVRAVDKFDPAKGTAFTFVSQVIANVLCTSVSNARKDLHRYRKLTKRVVANLADKSEDRTAIDDTMKTCLPLVWLAISFALPTYAQQNDVADPETTQKIAAIFKALKEAQENHDPVAYAANFTRDAVFVTPTGPIIGRQCLAQSQSILQSPSLRCQP